MERGIALQHAVVALTMQKCLIIGINILPGSIFSSPLNMLRIARFISIMGGVSNKSKKVGKLFEFADFV